MAPNIFYLNHVGGKVLYLKTVCLPQLQHIRYFELIRAECLENKKTEVGVYLPDIYVKRQNSMMRP